MTARKATAAKKTASKAAAAPPAAAPPEPEPDPAAHLTPGDQQWVDRHTALAEGTPMSNEVMLEDIPDGYVAAPLGPYGDVVHVKPRAQWRSSHLAALHAGDIEAWAQGCLLESDYQKVWVGLDPTLEEVQEMMRTWSRLTGNPDPGKSPVQRGSLRSGRRS